MNFESSCIGPPRNPGVYSIFLYSPRTKKKKIIYIGSSKNIMSRIMKKNHIYRKLFSRINNFYVISGAIITNNYKKLEIDLIKKYKPFFNKRHKNDA